MPTLLARVASHAQAQCAGYLKRCAAPRHLAKVLVVERDANHPGHVWDEHFCGAVRRLARALGVPESFFGLG